ncbi:hypothetical protein COO60DRAFT_1270418 [Scenedesmus sp. NREL 46B-D3]|nr:hypothetical protein COO60DRAFT_1270418 [Scenedesmus sp. NREL 46B-D3]
MSTGRRILPCNLWKGYCSALQQSPLLTKACTGVAGTMLGDLAAQMLSHSQTSTAAALSSRRSSQDNSRSSSTASKRGFEFDALRCGRLCLYSAAIGTPMGHYWYELLEALVMPASPTAPAAVAAKVGLDQLLQTPLGLALFFSVMAAMEGRALQVPQELHAKLVPGLLANWKLWPAAQLVNFTLIPPEQRILFGNIVGVCWTCMISNMQQRSSSACEAEGTTGGSTAAAAAAATAANSEATASSTAAADAADARRVRRKSTPMPA